MGYGHGQNATARRALPLAIVALGLLGATLLAACGGGASSSGMRLRVEGSEFRFSPSTIELTVGEKVTIDFVNTGATEHDLQAVDLPADAAGHGHVGGGDVHAHAMPGKRESVTFTPKAAGTYEFICTVPGHREAGMTGTFTVR